MTVLGYVAVGFKAFLDPPQPCATTYVTGSKVITLVVLLAVSLIPDAVLLWLILPHAFWWIAALIDILELYACVWAIGLYGSMVAMPHELSGSRVVFNNGALESLQLERADIASARVLGAVKRLHGGRKIFVASDAPHHLCEALLAPI